MWFKTGEKECEGNYKDGKEDGIFTKWYETGEKEFEWNFKDGKEVSVEWFGHFL